MEFTVSRADLVRELNLSQGVVEKKTTIPILSNVLVEADSDKIYLTATWSRADMTYPQGTPWNGKPIQQMGKDVGSGGPLVDAGRPLQTNQALQPFEAEFNAPSQPIEGKNVGGREVPWLE